MPGATPLSSDSMTLGPGLLYVAPLGSTEITDLDTAWPAAWVEIGFTKEGHTFSWDETFDGIYVAERKTPVLYDSNQLEIGVTFEAAEITLDNYKLALNGGTITAGAGFSKFEPRAAGSQPVYHMLGWQSDDGEERLMLRKVLQTDTVEIARKKSPDYATIPMSFKAVDVTGALPFAHFFDDSRVLA